jgi:hypothetical protein
MTAALTCAGDDDCTGCTLDAALNCRFEKKRLLGFLAMVIPFATASVLGVHTVGIIMGTQIFLAAYGYYADTAPTTPEKATSSDATPTTASPNYGDTTRGPSTNRRRRQSSPDS